MLTAMVAAALVVGVSSFAFKSFTDTKQSFRMARVKSLMATIELQVRRRALQPEAYQGCTTPASCRVSADYFFDLARHPVAGCKDSECAINLTGITLDPGTKTFRAEVNYTGGDIHPKAIQIAVTVPTELLQANNFHCGRLDPARPIFTGFDAVTNAPICVGFNQCAAEEFAHGLNLATRNLACKRLPPLVNCGGERMISSFDWRGGAVEHTCGILPEPPYSPEITVNREVAAVVTVPVFTTPPTNCDPGAIERGDACSAP